MIMKKKQATIKDIARELKISHSTVSRALSEDRKVSALVKEETKKRVQQKATEMDYSPNLMAQGFVTGRTGTLGLLTHQVSRATFSSQIDQILQAVNKHNYHIVVGMAVNRTPLIPQDDLTTQIKQLLSRGVDGLLINARGHEDESERILAAVRGRVPVVTFHHPTLNLSGVVLDLMTDFFEVTEHLIKLGHERIGFIGPGWDDAGAISAKAKGYLQAMQKHGLSYESLPALGLHAEGGVSSGPKAWRPVYGSCVPGRSYGHRRLSRAAGIRSSRARGCGCGGFGRYRRGGVCDTGNDDPGNSLRGDCRGGDRTDAGTA